MWPINKQLVLQDTKNVYETDFTSGLQQLSNLQTFCQKWKQRTPVDHLRLFLAAVLKAEKFTDVRSLPIHTYLIKIPSASTAPNVSSFFHSFPDNC